MTKSFLNSLRNFAIGIVLFSIILVLLSLASVISNLGNEVTGEVILIEGPETEKNITIEDAEIKSQINENVRCWMEGGLKEEDVVVIGNILKDVDCPSGDKKNITATIEGDCIILDIGDEAVTKLCPEGLKPVIGIELVKGDDGQEKTIEGVPTKNYYWYVLFFIALVSLVLFWREYEMNIKTDLEIKAERAYLERKKARERARKKAIQEGRLKPTKKKDKDTVVYLPPAPVFDEKKAAKEKKEKKALLKKVKESKEKSEQSKVLERNHLIAEFNSQSEKINQLIISGNLVESRKRYLGLFETYSKLSALLDEKNKENLDKIMQYLCHYLGALEKIKGTSRKSISQKILKDKTVIKPEPKLMEMEELKKMKGLIKEKKYLEAKNMFYGGKIDELSMSDAFENVRIKKEKDELDEIEVRHSDLMKKGVVNVSEDDFYNFMMHMTSLRKELKKRRSKPKKKS